jgi:C-terminal processing protease CtpA/Prc
MVLKRKRPLCPFCSLPSGSAVVLRKRFPAAPRPAPYTFERLPDGIGLLRFNSMSTDYESFARFLKDTFTALKTQPVKGLILDLRRNGGGNSALGFELINYITDKKFRMGGGTVWKVSESYKNWYHSDTAWAKRLTGSAWKKYLALPNGSMLRGKDKARRPGENPLHFSGPVALLIGPGTFSSANMTANAIRDYKLATVIGEPTGETANDFGEIAFFEMPSGKVGFSTSSKQFIRASGNAKDMNPVLPDILVKPDPKDAGDAVLEAARKWVNSNRLHFRSSYRRSLDGRRGRELSYKQHRVVIIFRPRVEKKQVLI